MKRSFLEFNNMSIQGVIEMKKPKISDNFLKISDSSPKLFRRSYKGCQKFSKEFP